MPRLVLVRHSTPQVKPDIPASRWHLSEVGRLRCHALADRLAEYLPGVIVSSVEPKAAETAQLLAASLGLPHETREGLHEHRRESVPFYPSTEEFESVVSQFFQDPNNLVFGEETAVEAHKRFSEAIEKVLEAHPGEDVAVVAHGTVITLFVAPLVGLEPFALWKRLGMPSFVVLSRPDMQVVEIVEDAGGG